MEAPLAAPVSGRVVEVVAEIGEQVSAGSVLVIVEPDTALEQEAA